MDKMFLTVYELFLINIIIIAAWKRVTNYIYLFQSYMKAKLYSIRILKKFHNSEL